MNEYTKNIRISGEWEDYQLLDSSCGERLEKWGDVILIRPDPQVIWNTKRDHKLWDAANARYHRSSNGGGHWEQYKEIPQSWMIKYKDLSFNIKPMGFKHTGIFPEQAVNWDFLRKAIKESNATNFSVLNLFAYTGASTLACAKEGAAVCHVDASKGMVSWAKDNAKASGLSCAPIRFIVDDCIKFVERETRRKNKYDGIIMDPPSYGRGPNKEIWKLEEKLFDFLNMCDNILSDDAHFVMLNSYTTGLSPSVMEYLLKVVFMKKRAGRVISTEIGLPTALNANLVLPSGSTAIWVNK